MLSLDFCCGICGHTRGETYVVREMMLGTRDEFHYVQCAECACLQLVDPPVDWTRYYPESYHAFQTPPRRTGLRSSFRQMRNEGTFAGARGAARILARVAPYPVHDAHLWFETMGATKRTRILDVGCGSGTLLRDLRDAGFEFLLGVDPLIPPAVVAESRGLIRRVSLDELHGEFDVIMMHHSLEHIPDQVGTMRAAAALLPAGGWCLVRVPTSDSWAWETYRKHWVQLDVPRHFFLHSIESLTRLGVCAGLRLAHVADDSGELQFIGSDLYANDRPLTEMARPRLGARRRWRRMARALNAKRRGDQVACYFRKD